MKPHDVIFLSTDLCYLNDTYQFKGEGRFLGAGVDEKRGAYWVFDQTIFYPQGGGQPSDQGVIEIEGQKVAVSFVEFSHGIVRHYVDADAQTPSLNASALFHIDADRRIHHAKLHTAGHFLTHIVEDLFQDIKAIKGFHFPEGCYVGLNALAPDAMQDCMAQINEKMAADIAADLPIKACLSDYETINRHTPHLAPFTPKDKPTRIVQIGDYLPLPCGGTHVRSLGELGKVTLTKIKKDRLSYQLG
jgi:alanyl-tRNA synthetase